MTIEIHEPELEALIQQRMESGRFRSVEEVLLTALKSSAMAERPPSTVPPKQNLADFLMSSPLPGSGLELVSAMQASPSKDICLETFRPQLPVRDVVL